LRLPAFDSRNPFRGTVSRPQICVVLEADRLSAAELVDLVPTHSLAGHGVPPSSASVFIWR
jgi:hypothetical protein